MARQLRSSAEMLRSQGPLSRSLPLGDGFSVTLSLPGNTRLTPETVVGCLDAQKVDKQGLISVTCPNETVEDDDGTILEAKVPTTGKRTPAQLKAALSHRYGIEPAPSAAEKRAHAAPAAANGQ